MDKNNEIRLQYYTKLFALNKTETNIKEKE